MARKIYYTSKGQPYIKLASGKPKFIPRRSAGMADTGDLGYRKKRMHGLSGVAEVSLAELGKLVKAAGKCITIVTARGSQNYCPSHVTTRKKRARK
jgi:hypothetical protein